MTGPSITVVIACRNAEQTLATQLEALAGQDCHVPWDVVLVDNGSTDRSVEIACRYADRLALCIVDARHCHGPGQARNVGVKAARGSLVAFCDADDEVAPGWLQAMVHALDDHPLVAGRFEGERLNDPETLRARPVPQQSGLQTAVHGAALPHAGAGNLGIRRDVFLALGGFDPQLRWLEDTDLCWRAQMAGIPLWFEPDALLHMRLRDSLRGNARQGWEYGRAYAVLEQRYPTAHGTGAQGDRPDSSSRDAPTSTGRSGLSRRVAWRLAWSLGRRAQRLDTTNPLLPAPPRVPRVEASRSTAPTRC
jgi:glycosyltransferase involved in cell wall biosynthesis